MPARHKRADRIRPDELNRKGKDPAPQFAPPAVPDNLPVLTPQQFQYVSHRINGMRIVEAYREAYDTSGSQLVSQYAEASRVEANVNVKLWLDAARAQALIDTRTTKEQHSARLAYLSNEALKAGKFSPAIQAEYYRGRVEGHYVDIVEIRNDDLDVAKFLKQIDFLLGADQAMLAAAKLGVEYKPNRKKIEQSES